LISFIACTSKKYSRTGSAQGRGFENHAAMIVSKPARGRGKAAIDNSAHAALCFSIRQANVRLAGAGFGQFGGTPMSRDFEFKQLLRAYRSGVISQSTFETEMAWLEAGAPIANGDGSTGFKAFGRTYKSERAAVVSFLDKVRAGEANGGEAFAAWAEVCTTDCIRTGIRMVAEREAYHSRIFAQRLAELGGEARATVPEDARKLTVYLGDPSIPDNEKLLSFTSRVGKPEDAIKPICEFAELLKEDPSTREALRLFAEDELSSLKWIWDSCAALNAPKQQASTATPT
jgi:hypothetical protein